MGVWQGPANLPWKDRKRRIYSYIYKDTEVLCDVWEYTINKGKINLPEEYERKDVFSTKMQFLCVSVTQTRLILATFRLKKN